MVFLKGKNRKLYSLLEKYYILMIKVLCPTATVMLTFTEMYSKPCQKSKIEDLVKTVSGFQPLLYLAKLLTLYMA